MKRTMKKNLAKTVTLSVLLMLPYGMAQAETYTDVIQVGNAYDDYNKKTNSNAQTIKTVDGNLYIYDFGEDSKLEISAKNSYSTKNYNAGIFTSADDKKIKINNKLDMEITRGELSSSTKLFGIYVSGENKLIDRRFGGNITVTDGSVGLDIGDSGNVVYGGSGNLTVIGDNYYGETSGIAIGNKATNSSVYWGEGIIDVKSESGREREKNVDAISMTYSYGNKKVVLGIKEAESYNDLSKFDDINSDKFSETVTGLGEVTLNATAKNNSENNQKYVKANGIEMAAGEGNIVIGGKVNINATAVNNANYKEGITTEASGLNFRNYGTSLFDSTNITANAESNTGIDVIASGINLNVEKSDVKKYNILTYFNKESSVEVTAAGAGKVKAYGVITAKDNTGKTKTENNLITSNLTITTTTNGGTDVENVGIKTSGGNVTVNGAANISANANGAAEGSKVYGLWSTVGGNITINGTTTISTSGGQNIAVVAGTEGWNEESADFENPLGGTNNINLNYGLGSDIKGDIISGYGGNITIGNAESGISTLSARNNAGTLKLTGDALSANGGKLSINLTSGSTWTGRADDYQDADLENWADKHEAQFNPKFSHEIAASGYVNVNLAQGATWNVTGQSWISELDGNGIVDLTKEEGSDAVHIGKVSGNNTFIVNLKPGELGTSDMLYVADGTSEAQILQINNREEVLSGMGEGDRIRFATVANAGNGFGNVTDGAATFGRSTRIDDAGIFNVDFEVEYVDYKTDSEKDDDHAYNGGENFENSDAKPGTDYVDSVYGSEENAQNVYLVRKANSAENKSDAGKTIINMSKVNYNNAIYMDRLNKRVGEAKYLNDEENSGMWVRIRHDRIGKDDAFRSQNTMYEMGYDVKQDCDNGERRVGFAIDYMDGKAEYTGIAGDGDVKRYGLWLYDTWMGDKGHYTDYVAKWGHLENDFDIMARTTGEKISGDYSNNVFSVSAEYGKKNEMGSGWYFEPQAQLQLARVTGADYVTSQGTKVSLDGINSLIGRAGFRLGRDLSERSTVYVKADLLHEFLGEQDISAADATGTLHETYENEGTWYDVGFGFATAMGKNSYAFMDFEKSFGNDNDETYQINAGVQWTF